jgi:hypothetical protein
MALEPSDTQDHRNRLVERPVGRPQKTVAEGRSAVHDRSNLILNGSLPALDDQLNAGIA